MRSAVDVVAAMLGMPTITLRGFGPIEGLPARLAALRVISPQLSPPEIEQELSAHAQRRQWMLRLTASFAVLALALGAAWALAEWRSRTSSAAAPEWRVLAVEANSLAVQVGPAATGSTLRVDVGERLPNGEQLQATVPRRGAYITESSTVIVRAQARAGAMAEIGAAAAEPGAPAASPPAAAAAPAPAPAPAAAPSTTQPDSSP